MKHLKSILTILILAVAVAGVAEYAMAQKKQPIKVCNKCGQHYKGTHNCPKAKKPDQKPKSEPKPKPKSVPKQPEPKPNPVPKQPEPKPQQLPNQTFTVDGVSFTMVAVPGGTFTMGATSEQGSDAYGGEKPAHSVTLSSYYIGQTEVTQELWQAVMGENPSWFNGTGSSRHGSSHSENYGINVKRPVEFVSWDDCQVFIRKLNQMTGKQFRLPTEAEWEYAARGGRNQGYKYSGSNNIDDVAVYQDNSYNKGKSSSDYGPHSVASKRANELGLYDMSGNVWEWCSDWYGSYSSSAQTNPTGPSSGSSRVSRGGGWGDDARRCRVATRSSYSPVSRHGSLGLRLAL